MRPAGRQRSTGERGSALLIVFVFAAIIAIMLYAEMPVNVFEAQRNKEQLLVDRGNEYAHAVKLYYRKFGIFPPTMDALENTNRIRFLRHKFKDPFTGENNWRILHAGPAGGLIDSKVNNGGALNGLSGKTGSTGSFGGSSNSAPASDKSNSGFGNSNSAFGNSNSSFGSNSPGASGSTSSGGFGFSGYSGGWSGGASASGLPGQPGANLPIPQRRPAVSASAGGSGQGGGAEKSPDPTAPLLASNGQGTSAADATQNGSQPVVQSGTDKIGVPGNPAEAVKGLITNPNAQAQEGSGLAAGANGTGTGGSAFGNNASSQGTLGGGGIAGVASKVEGRAIKAINDQTNYSLWEFYYDPTKDATRGLAAAGQQGAAASAAQINGQNGQALGAGTQNSLSGTSGNNSQNGTNPDPNAAGNGNSSSPQQPPPPAPQ